MRDLVATTKLFGEGGLESPQLRSGDAPVKSMSQLPKKLAYLLQ